MFRTPRLLLEVKTKETWGPTKIYCNFKSLRDMLDHIDQVAKPYGGVDNVRVRYLATQRQIADAKFRLPH